MKTARPALQQLYRETFAKDHLDAIVFPTVPKVAVTANPDASSVPNFVMYIQNTDPGSNAGVPGIQIPIALGATSKLPVGMELDGPAGSDHRHADISDVFQDLNALVVNLAPDSGIRNVAERRPIHIDNEVSSRAGEDNDLVSAILCDAVKRIDKFRVALCVHNARPAVTMELGNQHALGVPCQLQLAIGGEIVRLSCLHGIVLSCG